MLKPASRMEGGFRLYSSDDIDRIEYIKNLRDVLGFSLAEIKEMVETEDVRSQLKGLSRPDESQGQRRARLLKLKEVAQRQMRIVNEKRQRLKKDVADHGLQFSGLAADLWSQRLWSVEDSGPFIAAFAKNVIFADDLGIDTIRARRMLSFLLTPECGLGPHRFAGCDVGWTISGADGDRKYGLFAEV